jgi:hypothetical protein
MVVGKGREHDCMDAGGTSPWMGEGRAMQDAITECKAGSQSRGCGSFADDKEVTRHKGETTELKKQYTTKPPITISHYT